MVVKFGVQQSRGAAGQSAISGKSRNFANLYQMNRAGQQVDKQAQGFKDRASQVNGTIQQANTNMIRGATGTDMTPIAGAVQRAKGISNDAQGYNPAVNMMKAGASPYQAGVGSFYAGGKNSQGAQSIRKFGNLYKQSMGRQADIEARNANNGSGGASIAAARTMQKPWTNPYANASQEQAYNDAHNDAPAPRGGVDVNRMNNLDWGLKTGRITAQQYYKAQSDPAYYQQLSDWFNKGG